MQCNAMHITDPKCSRGTNTCVCVQRARDGILTCTKMSSSASSRRRGHDADQHSDDDASAAKSKRPRRGGQKKKHIYLVIDDWEMGYSIHKLDMDDLPEVEDYSDARAAVISRKHRLRRLPEPCAIRIEAPVDRYPADVAAIGSKILLVTDRFSAEAPILTYDTATASLAIGPRPTPALRPLGAIFFVPVAVDVDNNNHRQQLYAFNPRRGDPECSFEAISRVPRDEEDEFRLSRRAERLSVASVRAPMPLGKYDLVSARRMWSGLRGGESDGGATRSFDARSSKWTWHGEWQMPFQGQGYYVHELGAWVGIARDGFLCSCAVPSRRGSGTTATERERRPECRFGRKTMFREDPKRHVGQPTGATLTYMGEGDGRFCLVECAVREGVRWDDAMDGEVDGCVLHVTVFRVRCDKRGDLRTTDHRGRSYLVSRFGPVFAAQTFWM